MAEKENKRLSQKDILNKFYQDYNLNPESDVHTQETKTGRVMFRIITRPGIEKIQTALNIHVTHELVPPHMYHPAYEMEYIGATTTKKEEKDAEGNVISSEVSTSKQQKEIPVYQVVVKTKGRILDAEGTVVQETESFGEASQLNCKNADYLFAMAEKRGLSRVVLKLAGMYAYDFFGEDEADAFREVVKKSTVKTDGQ